MELSKLTVRVGGTPNALSTVSWLMSHEVNYILSSLSRYQLLLIRLNLVRQIEKYSQGVY